MKVLVLHDPVPAGAPPELADVLDQVQLVATALEALGHQVQVTPFTHDPSEVLGAAADVVVNLVESVDGDNARMHLGAAFLETLGLPFTGAGATTLAVSTHKLMAKRLLAAQGLRVPEDWPAGGPRYIVKPTSEDASVGIDDGAVVPHDAVAAALAERSARFGPCHAETYVHGREVNVSILETLDGPRVLPIAEITFDPDAFLGRPRLVSYDAKWVPDSADWRGTHRRFDVGDMDTESVSRAALAAWSALRLRGYGRVDMRVDEQGRPVIVEVNANPCLAADAGFMVSAAQAGLSPVDVVGALLARATRP